MWGWVGGDAGVVGDMLVVVFEVVFAVLVASASSFSPASSEMIRCLLIPGLHHTQLDSSL